MAKPHRFDPNQFVVTPGQKVDLTKISTEAGRELDNKDDGRAALAEDLQSLKEAQSKLYASDSHSLLIILQGMDAAGKDGTIRHVMGGINPQGCRVHSFKAPSSEELQHHFLWRPMRFLPERGMISIFNRSYYEEVLVVRVHPKFLTPQKLPNIKSIDNLWPIRFEEINSLESTLVRHGTTVIKFFLHLSQKEQKKRLLERLRDPSKYWKFNEGDLAERKLWPQYQKAFESMLQHTSTETAPWYIIPADDKWYARAAIADLIAERLDSMNLAYPHVPDDDIEQFSKFAAMLEADN